MPRKPILSLVLIMLFLLCLIPPAAQAAPEGQTIITGPYVSGTVTGFAVYDIKPYYPWVSVTINYQTTISGFYSGYRYQFVSDALNLIASGRPACVTLNMISRVPVLSLYQLDPGYRSL